MIEKLKVIVFVLVFLNFLEIAANKISVHLSAINDFND